MSKPERQKKKPSPGNKAAVFLVDRLVVVLALLAALPDLVFERLTRLVHGAKSRQGQRGTEQFPEADSRPEQFFLLLRGLVPMWRSLLRELVSGLRRRPERTGETRGSARLRPAVFICAALALAGVIAFSSLYTTGTAVSYNGQTLEVVENPDEARKIAAKVEGIAAEALGGAFSFSEDTLRYSSSLVRRSELGELAELEKQLTDELGLVTYGYSLYIDDELVGSTQYEGALEALLEQITRTSTSEDTLSADFVEQVDIREGYVPTDSLVNLGYIAEVINSTKAGEVTYTVQRGDTWGKIAYDNGMSNAELEALNPGYDIDHINIGDELVLSREVPYLTVKVTERQNYTDEVNYDIVYVDDSSMYQGDTRVLEAGEYGTADIVADVEYVNGVEMQRTVISQVMLTAPKTETRARGTKERPSWLPTGSFRWPASGRITSGFGYRNTGIRGASTNHMGIDIACSYGSPIYAADGGTVEYTGYKGAMGYTVIINHGNGYKTYYEHCSSFTCSAGQHVYKGQQIAKVGRSGVASGSHCHFGIQKNGTYVNPLNYLP